MQDIALIRAAGLDINIYKQRIYLHESHLVERSQMKHTDDQVEDELYTIVDLGGRVRNVM